MNRSRQADLAGAGLTAALAVAVVVSALINHGGNPSRTLATLVAAGLGYSIGRVLVPVVHVTALLVVGALALSVASAPPFLWSTTIAPPLWYANANAALYVQVTALVAMSAISTSDRRWRTLAGFVAVGLVVLTATTGALAGAVTGVAVLASLLAAVTPLRRHLRALQACCVALVVAAHFTVLVLGAGYAPRSDEASPVEAAAASSLSERRLALWSDAVSIAAEHPLIGVGPGRFSSTSPTARADSDTSQAHSATLQVTAETGWLGGAALLGLLLWAVCRPLLTATHGQGAGRALVAAVSLTALAVHGAIDYVLAFPAVVVTAALVLGVGTGRPPVHWPAAAKRPARLPAPPPRA